MSWYFRSRNTGARLCDLRTSAGPSLVKSRIANLESAGESSQRVNQLHRPFTAVDVESD
jgi:hypothetical protein